MGHDPAVDDDGEGAQGQGANSRSVPELFPEEPRISLDDANYSDVLLEHAAREAVNVASLSLEPDSGTPWKQWAIRSAPSVISTIRRRSSVLRGYFNLIQENLGYLPAWPIEAAIKPGDVGMLVGGTFIALANLENMGIKTRTSTSPAAETVTISTRGTTRLSVESTDLPTGDTISPPVAASQLEIRMRGEDSSLAHWEAMTRIGIDDMKSVEKAVLNLVKGGEWPKDGVLITEVLRARNGLILISNEKESLVKCQISRVGRDVVSDPISALADPSLRISSTSGVAVSLVLKEEFTACIRASRIKRSFLSSDSSLTTVDRWE